MYAYSADELAQIANGVWHAADRLNLVSSFCFDARQIQSGACFVALSGGARDGHEFIEQASKGGASCAFVESVADVELPQLVVEDSLLALGRIGQSARSRFASPVVGITGSCGKTSTKEMLRLLLGEASTHATAGNWNNRIGVPMTLIDLDPKMHDFAVIEAGINQPGEMQHLGEMIRGDLTIVTNVGPAHLELLETVENVAIEKARLAQAAKEGSPVVFASDLLQYPVFRVMADRAIVLHPESEPEPDVSVRKLMNYRLTVSQTHLSDSKAARGGGPACPSYQLSMFEGDHSFDFIVQTPSRGIATNAALAIVAAQELGIGVEELQARIANWQPATNRGRMLTIGNQFFYVDCYNANPASMTDAILAFGSITDDTQPRAYVLGAMNELGETAEAQHRQIGLQLNLRSQDRVFFIGPKSLCLGYQSGAVAAGNRPDQLQVSKSVENIKSEVAEFSGALFLKGSRSYQLETLLPEGISNS
ncbi:MAG TPA: hypothetical protein DCX06_14445 [Opitutae bacterium]|nr:hypothetical protein [Opitutae bacterium]